MDSKSRVFKHFNSKQLRKIYWNQEPTIPGTPPLLRNHTHLNNPKGSAFVKFVAWSLMTVSMLSVCSAWPWKNSKFHRKKRPRRRKQRVSYHPGPRSVPPDSLALGGGVSILLVNVFNRSGQCGTFYAPPDSWSAHLKGSSHKKQVYGHLSTWFPRKGVLSYAHDRLPWCDHKVVNAGKSMVSVFPLRHPYINLALPCASPGNREICTLLWLL